MKTQTLKFIIFGTMALFAIVFIITKNEIFFIIPFAFTGCLMLFCFFYDGWGKEISP